MKPSSRFIQKLEILGDGDHVLAVVPLLTHMKVPEDLGRNVRFERPFYQRTKTLFGPLKIGVLRSDVQKAETPQLAEKPLICREMCKETRRCFKSRIHEAESDHRRNP